MEEKPWSLEKIRKNSQNWTLEGDVGLVGYLEEASDRLLSGAEGVQNKLNDAHLSVSRTSVQFRNVQNSFLALANTQFIENRVYDDDVPTAMKTKIEEPKSKAEKEAAMVSSMRSAVQGGCQMLRSHFHKIEIKPEAFDEDDDPTFRPDPIYDPLDSYLARPLPLIIGSKEFLSYKDVCADEDEEAQKIAQEADSEDENVIVQVDSPRRQPVAPSVPGPSTSGVVPQSMPPSSDNSGLSEYMSDEDDLFRDDAPTARINDNSGGARVHWADQQDMQEELAKKFGLPTPKPNEQSPDRTPVQTKARRETYEEDVSRVPPPMPVFDGRQSSKVDSLFESDAESDTDDIFQPPTPSTRNTPSFIPKSQETTPKAPVEPKMPTAETKAPPPVKGGLFGADSDDEDIFAPISTKRPKAISSGLDTKPANTRTSLFDSSGSDNEGEDIFAKTNAAQPSGASKTTSSFRPIGDPFAKTVDDGAKVDSPAPFRRQIDTSAREPVPVEKSTEEPSSPAPFQAKKWHPVGMGDIETTADPLAAQTTEPKFDVWKPGEKTEESQDNKVHKPVGAVSLFPSSVTKDVRKFHQSHEEEVGIFEETKAKTEERIVETVSADSKKNQPDSVKESSSLFDDDEEEDLFSQTQKANAKSSAPVASPVPLKTDSAQESEQSPKSHKPVGAVSLFPSAVTDGMRKFHENHEQDNIVEEKKSPATDSPLHSKKNESDSPRESVESPKSPKPVGAVSLFPSSVTDGVRKFHQDHDEEKKSPESDSVDSPVPFRRKDTEPAEKESSPKSHKPVGAVSLFPSSVTDGLRQFHHKDSSDDEVQEPEIKPPVDSPAPFRRRESDSTQESDRRKPVGGVSLFPADITADVKKIRTEQSDEIVQNEETRTGPSYSPTTPVDGPLPFKRQETPSSDTDTFHPLRSVAKSRAKIPSSSRRPPTKRTAAASDESMSSIFDDADNELFGEKTDTPVVKHDPNPPELSQPFVNSAEAPTEHSINSEKEQSNIVVKIKGPAEKFANVVTAGIKRAADDIEHLYNEKVGHPDPEQEKPPKSLEPVSDVAQGKEKPREQNTLPAVHKADAEPAQNIFDDSDDDDIFGGSPSAPRKVRSPSAIVNPTTQALFGGADGNDIFAQKFVSKEVKSETVVAKSADKSANIFDDSDDSDLDIFS